MGSLNTQIAAATELAFMALVNRAAFGRAVQRVAWRDGSVDWTPPSVVVKAGDVKEAPCAPLYSVRVSLTAYTYAPEDENQAALNAIHGDLEALAANITITALTAAATNLIIHGVDVVGSQDTAGDELQGLSVDLDVSVEAEFAAFTTTTTTTT
jgi:hypothetical protein